MTYYHLVYRLKVGYAPNKLMVKVTGGAGRTLGITDGTSSTDGHS